MSSSKCNGIVLKSFDYDQNGKVVTIFSDKYGKLSFVAMGVNKITSKNKYSILSFCESEFEIFKSNIKDNLSKLKTGTIIKDNLEITKNYNAYINSCIIARIVIDSLEDKEKNYKLYRLLSKTFSLLNSINVDHDYILGLFLIYASKYFGANIEISSCCICGSKNVKYLSFEKYGMICDNCSRNEEPKYLNNTEMYKIFLDLQTKTFDEMVFISRNKNTIKYLLTFLNNFYKNVLGITNEIIQNKIVSLYK